MNLKNTKSERVIEDFLNKDSDFWTKQGQENTLHFFHKAAEEVPAYKDFLKKNSIDHKKIKSWKDFQTIPFINKNDYLKKYPREMLYYNGMIDGLNIFTSTSGTTGEPFYFSRSPQVSWQSSIFHEFFVKYSLENNGKVEPTLVLIAFGMGVWIGGLITFQAFEQLALRNNYPISILAPGVNKKELFYALRNLAPNFKNIVIVGYPPFVKDLLDEARYEKIEIDKLNIKFVCAAETFTEGFRDYLIKNSGNGNLYRNFLHVYGSADIGSMAAEMPTGVLIKRLCLENKELFKDIFGDLNKFPTLAQFDPTFVNFEEVNGEIVLSGNNNMPLIRYAIGDRGGVYTFDEIEKKLLNHGINIWEEAKKVGIEKFISKLPFVYVYERIDMSTTLYGINIYPQLIRDSLLHEDLQKYVTGKFTLSTNFDDQQNQFLDLHIELKKGAIIQDDLKNMICNSVVDFLYKYSSEYKELKDHIGEKAYPRITLWNNGESDYFKPGIKQKWIKK